MGCDIHMYVEYRQGNGMPWITDENHIVRIEDYCGACNACDAENYEACPKVYKSLKGVSAVSRNYGLFGLLASVRFEGIRKPLGLPEDVTQAIKTEFERWGHDAHSESYMTLEEFKKVIFEEYQQEFPEYKNAYIETENDDAFFDWSSMSYDKRPPSYTTLIRYCEKLKERKSLDKILLEDDSVTSEVQVRLVFWFDN